MQRASADPAILATRQDHSQAVAAMHPLPRSSPKLLPSILELAPPAALAAGCLEAREEGWRKEVLPRRVSVVRTKRRLSPVCSQHQHAAYGCRCFSRLRGGSGLRSWINERACSILVSKERSKSSEHTPSSQNNLSIIVQLTAAAALLGPAVLLGREAGSPVGPARVW